MRERLAVRGTEQLPLRDDMQLEPAVASRAQETRSGRVEAPKLTSCGAAPIFACDNKLHVSFYNNGFASDTAHERHLERSTICVSSKPDTLPPVI